MMGLSTEALKDLDQSTSLDPTLIQSWVKKASVHMELGEEPSAMQDFEKAIAVNANDPDM